LKLSIGIPVFNGAMTIGETLESVIPQVKSGVEIVVSDNGSTDDTAFIVAELVSRHPFIRYFRNTENLGFDANVLLTVERSLGDFVWLLGADDEIADGGIESVLTVISQNISLGAVFVNYGLYDRLTGKCNKERFSNMQIDVPCKDESQFLATVGILPNFMSSVVINRQVWGQQDAKSFLSSNWMHLCILLNLMPGRQAHCVAKPYVLNKGVNVDGPNSANRDGVALSILLDLCDIVSSTRNLGYKDEAIAAAISDAYRILPAKISSSRRNGLEISWKLIRRMIKQFGSRFTFWVRDLPLLFFPRVIHYVVWKIYRTDLVQNIYWRHMSHY